MITTNIDKKNLVEKLLSDRTITIDQAFMLLDDADARLPVSDFPFVQPIVYPNTLPYYQEPWFGIIPPTGWPYSGTICSGTSVTISGSHIPITNTITYSAADIDGMLADGRMSYTMN